MIYTAAYADALGRGVAAANYGTGGGTEPARPATIPASSSTCLVCRSHYNDRGENDTSTDPQGTVTRREYDAAGQLLKTIENYRTSGSETDINKATEYTYNGDVNLTHMRVMRGTINEQITEWVYGTALSESDVASSQLVRAKIYADSTSGSDRVAFKFNRLGQVTESKDQAGTVHIDDYDALERILHDRIATPGGGIDRTVLRLSMTYNARGFLNRVGSHSSADVGSGSVVNDVQFGYNSFNQLVVEQQSHEGETTSSTPKVQYNYLNGSGLTARRTEMTYPDGRVIALQYGSAGSLDDLTNRIAGYQEWSTPLVVYTRRGINSTVKVHYSEPAVALSYIKLSNEPVSDGGDQYTGLDRYNRIVDIRWLNVTNNAEVDRYRYGFDQASNRRWRQNTTGSGWDECYTYDGLYQLKKLQRGTLNGAKDGISGTPAWEEKFTYDPAGNWNNYLTKTTGSATLNQNRTHNKANEILTIAGGSTTVGYDPVGNMTTTPRSGDWNNAQTLKWDAWNRLVEIRVGTTSVAQYRYDGLSRRVTKASIEDTLHGNGWQTRHYYYSNQWQILEERLGSDTEAARQFVWGTRYRDDLILRDRFDQPAPIGSEEPDDSRLYVTHDQLHPTSLLQPDDI